MPDTPGKRRRIAIKAQRRLDKEQRRAARKAEGLNAMRPAIDENTEDQQAIDSGVPGDDGGAPRPLP
jgi:hypothetical protein